MSKVMLVEDDNNLREIYEARLQAEGYDIVTAHDGEEALVVAKAENPDLVISDVMMPKISGFEMLDILRNTDGLKDVKVIMLTALGQSDDQQRADKLGADAYLVKSQVTLEDIVKVAQRLLGGGEDEAPAPEVTPVATAPAPMPVSEPVLQSVAPEPDAPAVVEPVSAPEPVVAAAPEPVGVVPPMTLDLPPLDPPPADPQPVAAEAPVSVETSLAVETPLAVETTVETETAPQVSEPAPVAPAVELPDAEASLDESADIMSQIAQFEAETVPAPLEVAPVAEEASPSAELPAEQFMTTAAPDLTTAAPAPDPAVAGNNEDVLNTALENLTGLPAVPGQETSVEPATSEAVAPGNEAVQRGGGRVITPIESAPKPDLNSLLAAEEAKEAAVGSTIPGTSSPTPSAMPAAQQPAQPAPAQAAVSPAPVVGQQPGQSFDPNSIAL